MLITRDPIEKTYIRKIFWSSNILALKKEKNTCCQMKLTEMEQNWVIFTPYGLIKNIWRIHLRESHVKFMGKNKVGKMTWLVKNGKSVFSKLMWKISLSDQLRRRANTWPLVFLSQVFRCFPVFQVVILVKYPVLFFLGKCLMDS